jgi:hypothetical protein
MIRDSVASTPMKARVFIMWTGCCGGGGRRRATGSTENAIKDGARSQLTYQQSITSSLIFNHYLHGSEGGCELLDYVLTVRTPGGIRYLKLVQIKADRLPPVGMWRRAFRSREQVSMYICGKWGTIFRGNLRSEQKIPSVNFSGP